jgi:hypothetical protein
LIQARFGFGFSFQVATMAGVALPWLADNGKPMGLSTYYVVVSGCRCGWAFPTIE